MSRQSCTSTYADLYTGNLPSFSFALIAIWIASTLIETIAFARFLTIEVRHRHIIHSKAPFISIGVLRADLEDHLLSACHVMWVFGFAITSSFTIAFVLVIRKVSVSMVVFIDVSLSIIIAGPNLTSPSLCELYFGIFVLRSDQRFKGHSFKWQSGDSGCREGESGDESSLHFQFSFNYLFSQSVLFYMQFETPIRKVWNLAFLRI